MNDKHTPLPWMAAAAYSSVAGVPIVGQMGQRVCNTALPDLPEEFNEMKRRAVADAALIVRSVNALPELVKALEVARERINYLGICHIDSKHYEANEREFLPLIDAALAKVKP